MPYNLTAEGAETNRNVPYAYAPGFPVIAPTAPAAGGTVAPPRQLTWDEWARRAPTATGVAPPTTPAATTRHGGDPNATWSPAPSENFGLNMVVGGGDNPLPEIANRVEADAAKNGLTAWGYSLLRQLGRTIKPEWLKESSKEWFNKELPEPWIPPKEEFLKFVEPFAGLTQFGASPGVNQLRHKYGLDVDPGFRGHEYVLEQDPVKRQPYLYGPEGQRLYDDQGRALPGTVQTPSLRAQAEAAAQKLAQDQAAFTAENSIQTVDEDNPPAGMTRAQARAENRRRDAEQLANFESRYGSSVPGTPAPAGSAMSQPAATSNFLPPYLQPGQPGQPGGLTTAVQPSAQPAPVTQAPVTPPGSPLTPFVPDAATGAMTPPGSPVQPFAPQFAQPKSQGGFAAAAKILELPFYLRGLYG